MTESNPYLQDIKRGLASLDLTVLDGHSILVTGATGLIGGCLVDVLMHCSASTCQVYASGRNEERARRRFAAYWDDSRFHFVQGDVTTPLDTNQTFDYIIHAASNASPNFFKEKPVEVIKSNIKGVENLMEYGLSHGMRRLLYVSSGEIYGERQQTDADADNTDVFTETDSGYVDCATPRACYPSSKRAAETLCVAYAAEYGADVVIARPCHTYGPYFTESDNRVYAQFIRNLLAGEDLVLKSRGEQFRSWLYVVDCAFALLTILLRGCKGEAYNVADEQSNITIRQLAELLAEAEGRQVVFDIDETNGNTTPITRAVFSTEKLARLGWQSRTPIAEGLAHTLAAQRLLR